MPAGRKVWAASVSEVVTNAVLHASITPSPGRDLDLEIEPLMMPAPVGVPRPGQPGPSRSGPARTGRGQAGRRAAPDHRSGGLGRCPVRRSGAAQGIPAAAAARRGLGVGGGLRPDLRLPRIRTAAETDEGGRGLYLVEQAGDPVGIPADPGSKAVWFEMPRSGDLP